MLADFLKYDFYKNRSNGVYVLLVWRDKWSIIKSLFVDCILCYNVTSLFFFKFSIKSKVFKIWWVWKALIVAIYYIS